jgi:hypothetical protein
VRDARFEEMKPANEGADADAHGNCRLFVVSSAMPLIFSDDVMLKSKLGPVLDLRLSWASVSNPSPSPLFGRREAGVLILVVFQSGL